MIYFIVTAAVILVDQLVKRAVLSNMTVGETIPLLENIFHITYVQNRGAAFSMWEQQWVCLLYTSRFGTVVHGVPTSVKEKDLTPDFR